MIGPWSCLEEPSVFSRASYREKHRKVDILSRMGRKEGSAICELLGEVCLSHGCGRVVRAHSIVPLHCGPYPSLLALSDRLLYRHVP